MKNERWPLVDQILRGLAANLFLLSIIFASLAASEFPF